MERNDILSPASALDDWRVRTILDALATRDGDSASEFRVMAALRNRFPCASIRYMNEATIRMRAALEFVLPRFESVLPPALRGEANELGRPIFGWWTGADSDGNTFEMVLTPNLYGTGEWILAGENDDALTRLSDAAFERAARPQARCLQFTNGEWHEAPELLAELERTSWADIILPRAQVSDIRSAIDGFFTQRATFQKMGFAWRRGILLIGPPGTGKTLVCKAVAQSRPEIPFLYVRDLREGHSNGDALEEIFAHARRCAPCLLAFEDIDGMLGQANRAAFLNELDGFKNNEGILLIASSNHPEKIDAALLKRPSRFDRVYHIGLPEHAERVAYGKMVLARLPDFDAPFDRDALAESVAEGTDGFTPAFLKEAFLSARLQTALDGTDDDPTAFADAVATQVDSLRAFLKSADDPERLAEMAPSSGMGFRPGKRNGR